MPRVSPHFVKSLIRLVRQSTTVPNTSNTSAFTADMSDMLTPFFVLACCFHCHSVAMRQHGARNLEILRCAIAHLWSGASYHPGMTKPEFSPNGIYRSAGA